MAHFSQNYMFREASSCIMVPSSLLALHPSSLPCGSITARDTLVRSICPTLHKALLKVIPVVEEEATYGTSCHEYTSLDTVVLECGASPRRTCAPKRTLRRPSFLMNGLLEFLFKWCHNSSVLSSMPVNLSRPKEQE